MTRTRWLFAVATGLLCLLVSFAADPVRSTTLRSGTLRIRLSYDLRLDYAVTLDLDAWSIAYATCANLMTYPDRGGQSGALRHSPLPGSWRGKYTAYE